MKVWDSELYNFVFKINFRIFGTFAKMIKGTCSEIIGKWILFKLAYMVTFQPIYHSRYNNCKCVFYLQALWGHNVNVTYWFINSGKHVL